MKRLGIKLEEKFLSGSKYDRSSSEKSKDERKYRHGEYSSSREGGMDFMAYLTAMKQAKHHKIYDSAVEMTPRDRRRATNVPLHATLPDPDMKDSDGQNVLHISTIASMVPDEIIYKHSDHTISSYETALMFIDISGFTDLCENYTKHSRGGPSRLTEVLNNYIGAMVQEIITHNGDVLKFSGDAFLSMWKKTAKLTMQDVVHTAIDCGLIIQKNYGTHMSGLGIRLKVKCAISAGVSHFAIIGDKNQASYVIVGQPVWDVKAAEYLSSAGDVLTTASAWMYVNEAEYCTQPCGDGRHTKVLGVGVTWKRVEKVYFEYTTPVEDEDGVSDSYTATTNFSNLDFIEKRSPFKSFREFSLRPSVVSAMRGNWWPCLRRFMLTPVLRAVENDEPMDFLTEVRHVVVLFVNIITKTVTEDQLIGVVDAAYKHVCSVVSQSAGLLNKVSMFDKDMMFLVVFGLRGLKHEDEAQKALLCAFTLKETLLDPNIISLSIGLTSGRTYCGVVGHKLRREYTVIGSSVNKAARLMTAYPNKVICDKETFVRSKLDLEHFRLLPPKRLKGIPKPGPVYEFNKSGFSDRSALLRHRVLGRTEELKKFKTVFQNAMERRQEKFTRYRYMQYGVIILGPRTVGKKRMLYEFISLVPTSMRFGDVIRLTSKETIPFHFLRLMMYELFATKPIHLNRSRYENRIRYSVRMIDLVPIQIYALNVMFGVRFPLPEDFKFSGDVLKETAVKDMITKMFTDLFPFLRIVSVLDGQNIDDSSWRALIRILDTKALFIIMTINHKDMLSKVAQSCVFHNIFAKINLTGIDRWYHSALICQLLDVEAIPPDLERVVQTASGGMPGWIQNLLISMMQRGELAVVNVLRSEAIESGSVMPSTSLLQRTDDDYYSREVDVISVTQSVTSACWVKTPTAGVTDEAGTTDTIQMAVLAENYNFSDIKDDLTMDVIILKTFDSLTPFEKWLLKCGSVLGDIFSRRMLLHLMQSDSSRKVCLAVAKLFEIRVLECEGGDFSRDTSMVLIHPAPTTYATTNPPFCACLGTRAPPNCRDLPPYAFCGYMKFRHSMFRTTTYELLTENHKNEMHGRALLFLERYSRRCVACGAGCFTQLFGTRSDDGLAQQDKLKLKRIRQQIAALSLATRMTVTSISSADEDAAAELASTLNDIDRDSVSVDTASQSQTTNRNRAKTFVKHKKEERRIRSFSSLVNENCECLEILLSVYSQVIDHITVVGLCEKLFEAYMEYVDLSLLILNIPQAIRLLIEVEAYFLKKQPCNSPLCKIPWMFDYRMARILTKRADCMVQSSDYTEAKKHLFQAMKLYGLAFPTSKFKVKMRDLQASFSQFMALYVCPRAYVGTETGFMGQFYDHIGSTLNTLCNLFLVTKEHENAELAAKWALQMTRMSNTKFPLLCISYANMIIIQCFKQNFKKCLKLEKLAMAVCHRKVASLDVCEIYTVCALYSSIFMFYVEYGKKTEGLDYGLAAIPMLKHLYDVTMSQTLVVWMLKLLLHDVRLHEMVLLMKEFFYLTDHYDLSSETWYYYYSMVILLDTGFCVEEYGACEKFYIKKGDAIIRSKTPEAAWNFFVVMWLVTVRGGAWERSILWEEKIDQLIRDVTMDKHEYSLMMLVRLVEGFLIGLVNEIDNKNMKKMLQLESIINLLFSQIKEWCKTATLFRPRYYFLSAYHLYLRSKKSHALRLLNIASELAREYGIKGMGIWIEHTRNHWKGHLNPKFVNYWLAHIEPGNLLDYRDYVPDQTVIIPYTLPLPKEFQ